MMSVMEILITNSFYYKRPCT